MFNAKFLPGSYVRTGVYYRDGKTPITRNKCTGSLSAVVNGKRRYVGSKKTLGQIRASMEQPLRRYKQMDKALDQIKANLSVYYKKELKKRALKKKKKPVVKREKRVPKRQIKKPARYNAKRKVKSKKIKK